MERIEYTGHNTDEVANFVRDIGGSCTSPLAVEFNGESFKVATSDGGTVALRTGDAVCWNGWAGFWVDRP